MKSKSSSKVSALDLSWGTVSLLIKVPLISNTWLNHFVTTAVEMIVSCRWCSNSSCTSDLRCSDLVIVSLQLCIVRRNFSIVSEVVSLPGLIYSSVGVNGDARMVRIEGDFRRHGQESS
jgi:hypothetical protein